MTNTPDCSKCAIRHQCDTANTGNCWLNTIFEEQSEYLIKKMEMILKRIEYAEDINDCPKCRSEYKE